MPGMNDTTTTSVRSLAVGQGVAWRDSAGALYEVHREGPTVWSLYRERALIGYSWSLDSLRRRVDIQTAYDASRLG